MLRGGSWINNGRNLRAAQRNHNDPDNRNNNIGCRLCQLVEPGEPGLGDQRSVWPHLYPWRKQGARTVSRQADWPKAVRDLAPWIDSAPAPGSDWANHPPPQFPLSFASGYGRDEFGLYCDFAIADVQQRLRWIPPGSFRMGSPANEPERFDNESLHEVELTRGFWLGEAAVTQSLWQAVTGENPSTFNQNLDHPVEEVSWDDVNAFYAALNQQLPGANFNFATEAQWEYACRAGSETVFWWGDSLNPEQARYDWSEPYQNATKQQWEKSTVPVSAYAPNPWGLYQMHGNVWDWCKDWYDAYPSGDVQNPVGPVDGSRRVLRGGGLFSIGRNLRAARRFHDVPGDRNGSIGCRLCQLVPDSAGRQA